MNDIEILSSSFFRVTRSERHLAAELLAPARVLNTCPINGGLRTNIRHIVNHQSCEPVKHQARFEFISGLGQAGYQKHVCNELGLPADTTVVMGTAATMQYLGLSTHAWDDLSVTAIVTGGVTGNAGCAGDPADYDENGGTWHRTTASPAKAPGTVGGTINTILLFSAPLSESALARAVMTMTEAKSGALQELAIGSKTSWRLATGTGTDQFAVASPSDGGKLRTWTGKHTKAGELAGLAVREATLEALRWQNGLERSYTRSLTHALGRFGLSEEKLKAEMERLLPAAEFRLFKDNWNPVVFDPQLGAGAFALAAVLDRVLYGTIGASSARECLLNQGALIAANVAAQPGRFAEFRSTLAPALPVESLDDPSRTVAGTLALVLQAIALGWLQKWKSR